MHVAADRAEPFQLKGSSFTLVVLKVLDANDDRFFLQLGTRVRQAPQLFRGAPLVLDFSDSPPIDALDAPRFMEKVREQGLLPVAIQGVVPELAQKFELPIISGGRAARLNEPEPEPAQQSFALPPPPPPQKNTMVVTDTVRSGRRVYSRGDLVVLAPVSQGAELLADGHIHIYNVLRGRAIAGLNGDRSARIFCHNLQAELVSIAGLYRVSEDMDRKFFKKPVQIRLEADRLRIDLLS